MFLHWSVLTKEMFQTQIWFKNNNNNNNNNKMVNEKKKRWCDEEENAVMCKNAVINLWVIDLVTTIQLFFSSNTKMWFYSMKNFETARL